MFSLASKCAGKVDLKENGIKMQSETITEGLKRYSIGKKLRRLRLRKGMGFGKLSKHTGLSPSLLSKLERDLMHPTLPALLRIALVFSVGLEYFFNPEPKPVLEIVRKKERLRFPKESDSRRPAYHFESLDFLAENRKLNAYRPSSKEPSDRMRAGTSTLESSFFTLYPANWHCKSAKMSRS
jgi:transcriptional regulator with XRE-family HTH domain